MAGFRGLGRAHGVAGRVALAIGLVTAGVLTAARCFDGQLTASAAVAAGLVAV